MITMTIIKAARAPRTSLAEYTNYLSTVRAIQIRPKCDEKSIRTHLKALWRIFELLEALKLAIRANIREPLT